MIISLLIQIENYIIVILFYFDINIVMVDIFKALSNTLYLTTIAIFMEVYCYIPNSVSIIHSYVINLWEQPKFVITALFQYMEYKGNNKKTALQAFALHSTAEVIHQELFLSYTKDLVPLSVTHKVFLPKLYLIAFLCTWPRSPKFQRK